MIRKIKFSDLSKDKQRQAVKRKVKRLKDQMSNPNLSAEETRDLLEEIRKLTALLRG